MKNVVEYLIFGIAMAVYFMVGWLFKIWLSTDAGFLLSILWIGAWPIMLVGYAALLVGAVIAVIGCVCWWANTVLKSA